MNEYKFTSIFAPHMKSFLTMKESLGIGTLKYKRILKEFDMFFVENRVKGLMITHSLISSWEKTRVNDSRITLYNKYCVLFQFCSYMCHTGFPCFIPQRPGRPRANFIPYIFTHGQIQLFFRTCDELIQYNRGKSCILFALPALFRLLYSTGLRIGEAISIKNGDVDFKRRYIIIRKTKNQLQRLVPLNASMLQTMLQYKSARDSMPLENITEANGYFFISPAGKPLDDGNVYCWFRLILHKCGIPHTGNHQGPRLHDFRHTCAVHSFMKLIKSGLDIYCALPVISVLLGHRNIQETEKYVRLTQEMFPEIIKMEHSVTSFVFPSQPVIEIDYEA
jgi:integrase